MTVSTAGSEGSLGRALEEEEMEEEEEPGEEEEAFCCCCWRNAVTLPGRRVLCSVVK
jgi:hypothetical protein